MLIAQPRDNSLPLTRQLDLVIFRATIPLDKWRCIVGTQETIDLFNAEIVEENVDILLEQYKLYVKSANLTSSLRSEANTRYLTLNTILTGLLVGLLKFTAQASTPLWIVFAGAAGVLLNVFWFFSIRSYRTLNSGRFAVIQELEAELPARIYGREWDIITAGKPKKSKYVRQTYIEQAIPLAFCILYSLLTLSYIAVN